MAFGGIRGDRGRKRKGEKEGGRYDCMVCMYCVYLYDTGCCNRPFIGVGEDDGMISGDGGWC